MLYTIAIELNAPGERSWIEITSKDEDGNDVFEAVEIDPTREDIVDTIANELEMLGIN